MVHFTIRSKCPLCLTCEAEARYGKACLWFSILRENGEQDCSPPESLFPPESIILVDVVSTSETINGVATEELRVGFRATGVG